MAFVSRLLIHTFLFTIALEPMCFSTQTDTSAPKQKEEIYLGLTQECLMQSDNSNLVDSAVETKLLGGGVNSRCDHIRMYREGESLHFINEAYLQRKAQLVKEETDLQKLVDQDVCFKTETLKDCQDRIQREAEKAKINYREQALSLRKNQENIADGVSLRVKKKEQDPLIRSSMATDLWKIANPKEKNRQLPEVLQAPNAISFSDSPVAGPSDGVHPSKFERILECSSNSPKSDQCQDAHLTKAVRSKQLFQDSERQKSTGVDKHDGYLEVADQDSSSNSDPQLDMINKKLKSKLSKSQKSYEKDKKLYQDAERKLTKSKQSISTISFKALQDVTSSINNQVKQKSRAAGDGNPQGIEVPGDNTVSFSQPISLDLDQARNPSAEPVKTIDKDLELSLDKD